MPLATSHKFTMVLLLGGADASLQVSTQSSQNAMTNMPGDHPSTTLQFRGGLLRHPHHVLPHVLLIL